MFLEEIRRLKEGKYKDYFEKEYDDSFGKAIEKLDLPNLELLIEVFFIEVLRKKSRNDREKLDACFCQRKCLLENMFECTPENVERLYRMANLIKDRVAMLHDKGNQLYEQMCQQFREGKNHDTFCCSYFFLQKILKYVEKF
jgi:hypothetical protein